MINDQDKELLLDLLMNEAERKFNLNKA